MKRIVSAVTAFALMIAPVLSHALPHDDSYNVKSTVKQFIPYTDFHVINDIGIGVGTPTITEVNALGMAAILFGSTSNDVHTMIPIPNNVCVSCPMKLSVLWSTSASTITQTATFKILYGAKALGEGLAAAATALDTVITADAVDDTAYGLNETSQGVIAGGTLSRNDILHILVELDAVSVLNPATVNLHGMYIEYTREQL